MKLLVLGSGCPNCKRLEENTKKAVLELGLKADIGKVTDYAKIATYGVMSTPALVIGKKAVLSGRVPSVNELKEIISENL